MKICIIGANSFLANAIILNLKSKPNYTFSLLGKNNSFNFIEPAQFTFYKYVIPVNDLDVKVLLEADTVIYCAAAGVQSSKSYSPNEIYQVNAFEPIKLLNILSSYNYKGNVITFGSYFEIGNASEEIYYTEEQFINNLNQLPNDYCISKRILTQFISQKIANFPFALAHLVLPNIYGYGENPHRLIPYIIEQINNNKLLQLSNGNQKRQYLHVNDVADAVYKIVSETFTGILNLTNEKVISIKELVHKVLALAPNKDTVDVNFGSIYKRDMNMQFLALSSAKADKILKWRAKISLEKGIAEYLNNFKKIN